MKKSTIVMLLALFSLTGWSKGKTVVWQHPAAEVNTEIEGYMAPLLEVTRVELCPDETRLMLHVSDRPDNWVRFAAGIHLVADGKSYALTRLEGMEIEKETYLTDKGYADLVFHFEPLPVGTKRFDFTEGDFAGAFRILGIEDVGTRAQRVFPSLWRSERSGDWELGLYENFAIYDCKCWNYKRREQRGDKYDIILENEGREVAVRVGKNKAGRRVISIDGTEGIYSPITSVCLPDYPTKDNDTSWKGGNYTSDTVTFVGWLKDMPQQVRARGQEYGVIFTDIFANKERRCFGRLDSLGRFTIKIPVTGPTEFLIDWQRTFLRMPFEPGETYFLLYDFGEGHKLIMGRNSRLQNEILASPIQWLSRHAQGEMDDAAAMKFLEDVRQDKQKLMERLDETQAERPNISARYVSYLTGHYNAAEAYTLMKGRFYANNRCLPADYLRYVTEHHWSARLQPYTLYRAFSGFLSDYIGQINMDMHYASNGETMFTVSTFVWPYILRISRKAGTLSVTDEEIALVEQYAKTLRQVLERHSADSDEPVSLDFDDEEDNAKFQAFMEREDVKETLRRSGPMESLYRTLEVLDSIDCDQVIRDIAITSEYMKILDRDCTPLDEASMQFFDENVRMQAARDAVHALQDEYLALSRKDVSAHQSLRHAEGIEGMSDGEQLLRKLTEPYRGKLILLDVWGTWCGPCKAALANSKEEYERLKDYDIVYLYLCNGSTDESWQNVIKQYDLVGDNIVHYNLPEAQQSAIENFLGVTGFPTYKIIDREGNVLGVNADPRNLEGLARLLEQLK